MTDRQPRPTAVEPEARPVIDALLRGFALNLLNDDEPDAFAQQLVGWIEERGYRLVASGRLAVEPDGLPLDVLADALRDALSDEIVWRPILADDPWRYYAERVIARLTPTPAPPEARE